MILNRKDIFKQYPWLNQKNQKFIISADYNGIICASFLNHILGWQLVGYYNLESLWISEELCNDYNEVIWVDLNILPQQGRAIGGHIVSINGKTPKGFNTSCNPNILLRLTSSNFEKKFPFSTLIFLLWLHNYQINKNLLAKLLVLHSDDTWLKYQQYDDNVNTWIGILSDFNWNWLFQGVNKFSFEERVDQILYPKLKEIGAVSNFGKLRSKKMHIQSKQFQFNPDWDEDVILSLFDLFGNHLQWTPPILPYINKRFDGDRNKKSLHKVQQYGLSKFLLDNNIFSYAIPSPRIFNYTSFKKIKKSHILDS
tara:strand:+ start:1641 stop:2573 length:933 start_codon:yes stop_codon:yes gene_type:complete